MRCYNGKPFEAGLKALPTHVIPASQMELVSLPADLKGFNIGFHFEPWLKDNKSDAPELIAVGDGDLSRRL